MPFGKLGQNAFNKMKTNKTLFFLLFFFVCGSTQATSVLDSIITFNSEGIACNKVIYKRSTPHEIEGDYYNWSNDKNRWTIVEKKDSIFDSHGNLIYFINNDLSNETNIWQITYGYKYEYTYDGANKILSKIDSTWNTSTKKWKAVNKHDYSYDSKGNNTQLITYIWNSIKSVWDYKLKYKYTYNPDNLLTNYIFYMAEGLNWTPYNKVEYNYNSLTINNQVKYYLWNSTKNIWNINSMDTLMFDNQNNIIQKKSFQWNDTSKTWTHGTYMYSYNYDVNHNLLSQIEYNWNNIYVDYIPTSKTELVYDESNLLINKKYYSWDSSTDEFFCNEINKYFWNQSQKSNIIENKDSDIKIYPNPFFTGITISGLNNSIKIFIYGTNGDLKYINCLSDKENYIDLSILNQGTYYVLIKSKNKKDETLKIIKK